ncbi:MAG: 50S ribosomal protein L25 [Acidimicrobiia bacterium]|nr:50S ribosomal protein L25 [Acidimicrobiia bacterium]
MDQVTLRADVRTESGSRPAKRLRRQGLVPAVVYGRGTDPISVIVSARDLYGALRTEAGANALINLEVEGGDNVLTVAREIQRHPVRGEIAHLDFIKVSLDEAIQADVGIELTGEPIGVREEGGVVETIEVSVVIEALPTEIPSSIRLDISEMNVGDTLTIGDLPTIDGVTYVDDEDRPLVSVLVPRVAEEPEVEEGLEEIEGELPEGELAEGEAPTEESAESDGEG